MIASITIIKHSKQINLFGLALNYTCDHCSRGLKCENNSAWLTCAANSFDTSSQTSPLDLNPVPCPQTWVQRKPCQIKQARQVGPFSHDAICLSCKRFKRLHSRVYGCGSAFERETEPLSPRWRYTKGLCLSSECECLSLDFSSFFLWLCVG